MQIDRIMEAFAKHYCEQNPKLFEVSDTCYIISFSIIMLNTALHNPNVKQRITVEQFIKQNRGINSGNDLPRDILELIYKSIKEEPFKIPDETYDDLMYTFFSPEKEGWLIKQGGR
jgi:cytohesin